MPDQKYRKLQKLFWDYDFTGEELQNLLEGNVSRIGHLDRHSLYARMLSSLTWYEILDLAGKNHLEELLSNEVVGKIFSKDLKKKYGVAKRILSR